jgi:hypothetical protein
MPSCALIACWIAMAHWTAYPARKFGQQPIAGRLEHAATVRGHLRIDHA